MMQRRLRDDDVLRLAQHAAEGRLFPVATAFPRERSVVWSGHDVGPYLEFYRRVGGILYARHPTSDSDDAEAAPQGIIELAFVHDGMFHVFESSYRVHDEHLGGIHEIGVGHLSPGHAVRSANPMGLPGL